MQHTAYTDPQQLTLPIKFAPSVVRAHGLSVAHPRPLVSYGKDYGRVFCFRTSPRKAWRYAEVEYANAGSSYGALALDCDDADAYARGFLRSEIPPPNWRVFRPDTGHSHAVWTLAAPVHHTIRLSRDVIDHFKAGGRGWQTRIEAKHPALYRVLLAAMTSSDKSYLAYMSARLLELRRVLKPTGSLSCIAIHTTILAF